MYEICIEIDGRPLCSNPLITRDYNSKFLDQFNYYYLIEDYNCIINLYNNIHFSIEILDRLAEKGIKSNDFVNTIDYHRKNKFSPVYNAFSIVKEARVIDDLSFNIDLKYPFYEFKHLLQSSYLVACKEYIPIQKSNFIYADDRIRIYNNNEILNFIINKNHHITNYMFNKEIIDVTCHSHGCKNNYKLKNLVNETGANIYYLKFKNIKLKEIIYTHISKIKNIINNSLSNYLDIITSFYQLDNEINIYEDNTEIKEIPQNEKICIAYADYYPNGDIVKIIGEYIKHYNSNIDVNYIKFDNLEEFIIKRNLYDIYLAISCPLFDDSFSFIYNFIHELSDQNKKLFNLYFYQNDKLKISKVFKSTKYSIPLGRSRNIYNKQDWCKEITFSKYGIFKRR